MTNKRDARAARPGLAEREVRSFSVHDVEFRTADDGSLTLTGYASVVGVDYEMYGGPPYGWTERVAPGAFTKTLRESPDVQLLVNHEGLPLARTKSGTLQLSEDNTGLRVQAELDASDPDVQRLAPKVTRGDMDEMSFAFRVMRQEWDAEYTDRTLLELNLAKGDVSVVNYGANPATSFSLRSLLASRAVGDPDEDPGVLAQAVDAAIDEAINLHFAGQDDQAWLLVIAADQTVDELLEVLGVEDPDELGEDLAQGALGLAIGTVVRKHRALRALIPPKTEPVTPEAEIEHWRAVRASQLARFS